MVSIGRVRTEASDRFPLPSAGVQAAQHRRSPSTTDSPTAVRQHAAGAKAFRHPLVGAMTMQYQVAGLTADPGLTLIIDSAEPGSSSETNLRLLASWTASHDLGTDDGARRLAAGI